MVSRERLEKPETVNPSYRPPVVRTTAETRLVDEWPYQSGDGDSYGREGVRRLVEAVDTEAAAIAEQPEDAKDSRAIADAAQSRLASWASDDRSITRVLAEQPEDSGLDVERLRAAMVHARWRDYYENNRTTAAAAAAIAREYTVLSPVSPSEEKP